MMTQKECVYERVCEVAKHFGIPIDTELGKKIRQDSKLLTTIECLVIDDFDHNRVHMNVPMDKHRTAQYVPGLIKNWLVKDNRLAPTYVYTGGSHKTTIDIDLIPEPLRHLVEGYVAPKQVMRADVECECGAKHTSRPTYHTSWCPLD